MQPHTRYHLLPSGWLEQTPSANGCLFQKQDEPAEDALAATTQLDRRLALRLGEDFTFLGTLGHIIVLGA